MWHDIGRSPGIKLLHEEAIFEVKQSLVDYRETTGILVLIEVVIVLGIVVSG